MTLNHFRAICLSLPGAQEYLPFSNTGNARYCDWLAFSVGEKWFALVDAAQFEYCNLKCEPELSLCLQAQYTAVRPGYHMNRRHWISVYFNTDLPDDRVQQLVEESHRLVLSCLPKRVQQRIVEGHDRFE